MRRLRILLENLISNIVIGGSTSRTKDYEGLVIDMLLELGLIERVNRNDVEMYQLSKLGERLYTVLRKIHELTLNGNQRGNSSSSMKSVKAGLIT